MGRGVLANSASGSLDGEYLRNLLVVKEFVGGGSHQSGNFKCVTGL